MMDRNDKIKIPKIGLTINNSKEKVGNYSSKINKEILLNDKF